MSAETLRRAAALMRERAEDAYDWTVDDDNHLAIPFLKWDVESPPNRYYQRTYETTAYHYGTTIHMGSWHPAVALAVADWLDSVAAAFTPPDDSRGRTLNGRSIHHVDERFALTIARAYLGGAA